MEKWETGNGNIRYNKVAMNLEMNINEQCIIIHVYIRKIGIITE